MTAICKMTGKETELPCSASGCPLFGDCIVEFQKERRKSKPKQTNADLIRSMTDEELMQFLFNEVSNDIICSFCVPTMRTKCKCDGHCKNGILEWLKQPTEQGGQNTDD